MLTIRLSRIGKKNKPMYRLIISEKARDPYGRALEILGSYNPYTKEFQAKEDRIKYWLSQGSGMSPTVNNLLIEKGVIKNKKVKASKPGKKKKEEDKKVEDKKIEKDNSTEDKNDSKDSKDNNEPQSEEGQNKVIDKNNNNEEEVKKQMEEKTNKE